MGPHSFSLFFILSNKDSDSQSSESRVQTATHAHTHTHAYVCIYMYKLQRMFMLLKSEHNRPCMLYFLKFIIDYNSAFMFVSPELTPYLCRQSLHSYSVSSN